LNCRNVAVMRNRIHKIVAAFLILTSGLTSLSAQLVTVSSSFSKDSAMIGEQLTYVITVVKDPAININFPVFADTIVSNLELLADEGTDSSFVDGKEKLLKSYKVTSFEEGLIIVPPLPLAIAGEDFKDTTYTSLTLLTVTAPVVDTTQAFKPIKPPINTPVNLKEILPWTFRGILGILGLSLIIAIIWLLLHRDRLKEILKPVKEDPPHIVAFRELDRLKEEKLPEQGMVKDFYSRLTEIVRRYIEKQYGIPAMEATTLEILKMFSMNNPDDHILDEMLKELLELGDLVKFAKQDPLPVENQTNLGNAYLFVQKTYPLFMTPGSDEIKDENDVEPEQTVLGDE